MDPPVIQAADLGKCYQIYARPSDRLKQALFRGRRRYFREFWALKGLNFTVGKGETLGILGSNGSGKSTLLQLICHILRPTTGSLSITGRVAALLELGAGFNPEFTGRENVFMNGAVLGLTTARMKECFDEILDFSGIGDFIDQPVKTYSSGMYVRLAFAVAVNVSPDILVVDEALSVGDIRFQQKCMARIRSFCETGTVIFVSHDTAAITELCSRVLWVEKGALRQDGKPAEVVEKYLEYMYEGDGKEKPRFVPASAKADSAAPDKEEAEDAAEFRTVSSDVRQFGDLGVVIERIRFCCRGKAEGVIHSGHPVDIGLILHCHRPVAHPIVGFLVKDHMGRNIMGDSTELRKAELPSLEPGTRWRMDIRIPAWPNLIEGDYTLSIAVADGMLEEHVQCHWIHDAAVFHSLPDPPAAGLFSVSGTRMEMTRL